MTNTLEVYGVSILADELLGWPEAVQVYGVRRPLLHSGAVLGDPRAPVVRVYQGHGQALPRQQCARTTNFPATDEKPWLACKYIWIVIFI